MPKYIDAEAFKRKLIDEKSFFPAIIARALEEMPTADVVPTDEIFEMFNLFEAVWRENHGFIEYNDYLMIEEFVNKYRKEVD